MMAMAEDGSIWSWGSNGNGSLGIGISPAIQGSASSPTMVVGGHKFVECSLDGAALGAAAVDNNGHVWVWGLNGLATGVASLSAAVSSPTLIAQLAANFDTNARPHSVKHLTVTPGKTYPISVQAYAAMFGTEAVGQRPGMNKLTIEF